MHDGIVRTLTDVRHVPELRKNLISLGTLDSNDYRYRAGSTVTGTSAASSSDIDSDTTKLWHMRLRHMSERDMDVLSKQDLDYEDYLNYDEDSNDYPWDDEALANLDNSLNGI
ncbi:hypothetical protein RJ640_000824 [Escallonia rubra]|uniref:GAG-pre-integrase domain-containing protein n=1 Tax=Escallonia rubra TaxID=112253 RepID=A0AA88QVT9_9ASTE|nr:hypothetical protein RJ640_000824 [Escallonia rubra]